MGKEAKIGLAVILVLLIVLGVVLARRLSTGSSTDTAQTTAGEKEKTKIEGESKAGMAAAGLGEFKPKRPWDAKDAPRMVSPASPPGHPPRSGSERDLWNVASDLHKPRHSAGEAAAIAPPPSMMPEPPTPEDVDPNDRYASKHRPPEEHRLRGDSRAEGTLPPDIGQPGALPGSYRAENQGGDFSRYGHDAVASASGNRYGTAALDDRPAPDDHEKARGGYGPLNQGPDAAFAGNERHRPRDNASGRANAPDYAANNGQRNDGTYDVQPNDNFWLISEKIYGTGAYFKALEELNRGKVRDERLKVGQNMLAPDAAELEKKYPNLCPKSNHREVLQNRGNTLVSARNLHGTRSYTVAEGDTLFDIARYELGKASRWAEIYELNRVALGKDFDYLVPGTQLALPQDNPERPDPVTRRPGKDYRR